MTQILELSAEEQRDIFGSKDHFVRKIEKDLDVAVIARDGVIKVTGDDAAVRKAVGILENLAGLSRAGGEIEDQSVDYAIEMKDEAEPAMLADFDKDIICHTVSGKPIKPKFQNKEVERIIMTRPAIEAGEKLGFLPGDLQSKVDPYLRPLYDALYQIMGAENFKRNMENGLIEVAPLAYMRGRTLDNAYIILDEAQNTTPEQMKMFLTRFGFGSHAIITGDASQKDLAPGTRSGLDVAMKVLKNVDGISFINLTAKDVVRHPLVQKIVKAYEDYEKHGRFEHRYTNRRKV